MNLKDLKENGLFYLYLFYPRKIKDKNKEAEISLKSLKPFNYSNISMVYILEGGWREKSPSSPQIQIDSDIYQVNLLFFEYLLQFLHLIYSVELLISLTFAMHSTFGPSELKLIQDIHNTPIWCGKQFNASELILLSVLLSVT